MYSKAIFISITAFCIHTTVSAQKLPNKQEVSLGIPANVKINGKADEWDGQFEAYNSATQLNYTLANNDKELYVIVNSTENVIIGKILQFGITVTLSPATKGDKKMSVTYPLEKRVTGVTSVLFPNPTITDSLAAQMNAMFMADAKEMRIKGVKDITEEEISVYNAFDIRTAAAFGAPRSYTCEFAIPLKYIDMEGKTGESLKFDIQINGPSENPFANKAVKETPDGKYFVITPANDDKNNTIVMLLTETYHAMTAPYSFSGIYKLL